MTVCGNEKERMYIMSVCGEKRKDKSIFCTEHDSPLSKKIYKYRYTGQKRVDTPDGKAFMPFEN